MNTISKVVIILSVIFLVAGSVVIYFANFHDWYANDVIGFEERDHIRTEIPIDNPKEESQNYQLSLASTTCTFPVKNLFCINESKPLLNNHLFLTN